MDASKNESPRASGDTSVGSALTARGLVVGFVAIVALFAGWFFGGMPGMDHNSDAGRGHAGMAVESLSAADFGEEAARADVLVVNVHTPYEGELPGTDAFIVYDQIADAPTLPRNEDARILVYCRSGRMSEVAARTLMERGYTNVAQLRGGMQAWKGAGYELLERSS